MPELEEFQGTMSEKRDQLEKLKVNTFNTTFNLSFIIISFFSEQHKKYNNSTYYFV